MHGNLGDLSHEIARLIGKCHRKSGRTSFLGHKIIFHGRITVSATQTLVIVDIFNFFDFKNALVFDVELQNSRQRVRQTSFYSKRWQIEAGRTIRPNFTEDRRVVRIFVAQIQIIVISAHHEIVAIFRRLANGATIQNRLLVHNAICLFESVFHRRIFRVRLYSEFSALRIGKLQVFHLRVLNSIIILSVVFGSHFPSEFVHLSNPRLHTRFVANL